METLVNLSLGKLQYGFEINQYYSDDYIMENG